MPVITRNQRKNFDNTVNNTVTGKPLNSFDQKIINNETELSFILLMKNLQEEFFSQKDKADKIRVFLEIFKNINKDLPYHVKTNPEKWIVFLATVFNKTVELKAEYEKCLWADVDKALVRNFNEEYLKSYYFTMGILRNYKNIKTGRGREIIDDAQTEIRCIECSRPFRRNIMSVDYTGMDTIEPESEFDVITDIWADLTLEEDPDYEFEEDEQEDEQEDCLQLSVTIKSEVTDYLTQMRSKRNVPKVNYTGMDMTDEDEGQINVCKRWFGKDGNITYMWKKYPLSKANEIGDEDYIGEE
jgi:hypothetical protein